MLSAVVILNALQLYSQNAQRFCVQRPIPYSDLSYPFGEGWLSDLPLMLSSSTLAFARASQTTIAA